MAFRAFLKSSAEAESSAVGKYEGGSYVSDRLSSAYDEGLRSPKASRSAGVEAELKR